MLIDSHAHLHHADFDPDRAAVLQRATEAGVTRIIEIGYDLASSRAALALAQAHPQIFAVVGVQPNYAQTLTPGWLTELRELAAHPRALAIGEIGLDYHWDFAAPALQDQVFRAQLELARELGLPVVIHSREAQADTLAVLRAAAQGLRGVMHSFSGDWAYARQCLELDFVLSFSGPVTFPKAQELHEVAQRVGDAQFLIETDSPYLSPHPLRGRRNEPARVRLVAERIAALRGVPLEQLATQVWTAAEQLFWRLRS